MLKILSSKQQKEADAFTIKNKPISSLKLMEHAAGKCFKWIGNKFPDKKAAIYIFCGKGNNGGDGLVIARKLIETNYKNVKIYLVGYHENGSKDFETNLKRLKSISTNIVTLTTNKQLKKITIPEKAILVDAIFGTGLSGSVKGFTAEIIAFLNEQKNVRIAIDMPSGLLSNSIANDNSSILQANYTLTFESPKLSFLFAENEKYVGDFEILPIGIDKDFIKAAESNYYFIAQNDILAILKKRTKFSHKGNYGRPLVIAGSYGMVGAATLATKSCLKTGAGLTTIASFSKANTILQSTVPEAIFKNIGEDNHIDTLPEIHRYNAIAFGPGIGKEKDTANILKLLIQECKVPLVIDADGLNILAENKTWLSFIHEDTILTPHPGEFDRLFGKNNDSQDRLAALKENAQKYQCTIILKGAHTAIALANGNIHFNSTGNPGMAKGGSGDTLTGILVSLLAQGYSGIEASFLGVYIHGLAADIAVKETTVYSLTASDIIENIANAYALLQNN